MTRVKLIPKKIKHRFTLNASEDPVPFCSTEPYMNYRLPADPRLVRSWEEVTCGFCHHLKTLGHKLPIDRHLQAVQ